MAKIGLLPSSRKNILVSVSKKQGWALCVGAGISLSAFPNWLGLVQQLATRDCSEQTSKRLIKRLARTFSLDALIQTSQNRLSVSSRKFTKLLSIELYAKLKQTVGSDWPQVARALSASCPADLEPNEWRNFITLIHVKFPKLSAVPIARTIADLFETKNSPDAIISFNAETLLYSLITGFVGQEGRVETTATFHEKKTLDRITQSLSYQERGRIPYYHVHGILPIPQGTSRFHKDIGGDKLVFSEGEYLQLANSSFSWQSSVFLNACTLKSMVFVGVSLTDSNMRRWLSWVQKNKVNELLARKVKADSTSHYWINVSPRTLKEREWIEASVAHLGIRLVWIKNWDETGKCLREMAGLS